MTPVRGIRAVVAFVLMLAGVFAVATVSSSGAAAAAPNGGALGPNVYVFTPDMPTSQIQSTVDAIAAQQLQNQFGPQRYALLFAPGTYGTPAQPLNFQVGYYTEVAGLGASPKDVTINGSIDVYNRCTTNPDGSQSCYALDNFWRSLSNLTIALAGKSGCQASADFWATSQAASLRRVNFTGGNVSLQDYCSAGPQYASGGFIADSSFSGGTVINGSQQQFMVRNTDLDGWTNAVWNQVFAGTNGAPAQNFGAGGQYTTLPTTQLSREKPFLYEDAHGAMQVFVPAARRNSVGTTWSDGTQQGRSIPLSRFLVATPATSEQAIADALRHGRNLLLTPGVYALRHPIDVRRADTVVLGLGFATLVPQAGQAALHVGNVPGVTIAGLLVDAGPRNSRALVQLGDGQGNHHGNPADPTTLSDVFLRIGGATPGRATTALLINSDDVLLDNIWSWRADHGAGVGWTQNTSDHGLVVNGDHVSAYGLFVEHYQKDNVVWTGDDGLDVFFQNELPYDVPNQAAWMSSRTIKGYAAFLVAPGAKRFTGYGMGSYCFFNQGQDIHASRAFSAPRTGGTALHDLLTVWLDGSGGIDSVVDGTGAAVTKAQQGTPSDVVSYP